MDVEESELLHYHSHNAGIAVDEPNGFIANRDKLCLYLN